MQKTKFPFDFLISVFNSIILILYLINFDLPEGSRLFYIILFIALISFVSIFKIKFENILFKVINSFQLPIFTTIIVFFLFELIYFINPNIFPPDLRIWINKEGKNVEVIEYLDTSPFIKFKSNVKVRVRFYRGTTEQFQYSWITDSKGFKNKNLYYLKKTVFLIFFILLTQVFLGILTVLYGTQILIASLHQIGSIFLISSSLYLFYKNTNIN